jgi:hypothetical protein
MSKGDCPDRRMICERAQRSKDIPARSGKRRSAYHLGQAEAGPTVYAIE